MIKSTKSQIPNHKSGFTIIESLVAIAILVVAVMGTLSAVQTGLSSSTYSKDQITAFYLAQEAYEQVRNLRDGNELAGRGWLYGFAGSSSDPCYFGKTCIVSALNFSGGSDGLGTCSAPGNCSYLRQDAATGIYGYTASWPLTNFRREVSLAYVNTDEVAVNVSVTWRKGTVTRQFEIRGNLLNWQ